MSLPNINFLHFTFSDKLPRQDFKGQGQYGKVKSRSHPDVAHLQTPNQCPYQVSTSYTLQFTRYSPDKVLKDKLTTAKVKSRSHHDNAHLQPPTNVSTKYQLPTPYGFRDIESIQFYRSRSLRQGQSRSHHDVAHLDP